MTVREHKATTDAKGVNKVKDLEAYTLHVISNKAHITCFKFFFPHMLTHNIFL